MSLLAAALLAVALVACANGRSRGNRNEDSMPANQGASVARRVALAIPVGDAGTDVDDLRGFVASQRCAIGEGGQRLACHLPPLTEGGPHRVGVADLGAATPAMSIETGELSAGGSVVIEEGDAARIAGGAVLAAQPDDTLGPREYVETSWHAPVVAAKPLVRLAAIRGKSWALEGFDASARLWRVAGADVDGDPRRVAVSPDGGLVIVSLRTGGEETSYHLAGIDGATGSIRWRGEVDAMLSGPMMFSPDGTELALVARDPARCESCVRVVVVSAADGKVVRGAPLAERSIAAEATTAGFDGDQVWFYRYVPEHMTSEMAPGGRTRVPPACDYEVHDLAAGGKPPRTLLDAEGDWKKLTGTCQVRALIPLAGGHVAAIQVLGEQELAVVELDALP